MQEGFVLGNNAEASRTLATLEKLVEDLKAIQAGKGPTRDQLENAPLLDLYKIIPYTTVCLHGKVSGHPILGEARVHTSQLWALNSKDHWARTFSRFYRLGDSLKDLQDDLACRFSTPPH